MCLLVLFSEVVPVEQCQISKKAITALWCSENHISGVTRLPFGQQQKNLEIPITQSGVTWYVKSYENKSLIQSTKPHLFKHSWWNASWGISDTEKIIISCKVLNITQRALSRLFALTIAMLDGFSLVLNQSKHCFFHYIEKQFYCEWQIVSVMYFKK